VKIYEFDMEPDPFGNNRRAKSKARLRAKADLVKQSPTVDPNTGRISQQGSGTISRNINLDEPYNKPIPNDPWDKPKTQPTQQQPTPTVQRNLGSRNRTKPQGGVTIRRSRNFDNF